MGKQILLSDIPVHREQAPERGFFFLPEDSDGLAKAMIAAYEMFDPEQDAAIQSEARAHCAERLQAFGENYRRIVASLNSIA